MKIFLLLLFLLFTTKYLIVQAADSNCVNISAGNFTKNFLCNFTSITTFSYIQTSTNLREIWFSFSSSSLPAGQNLFIIETWVQKTPNSTWSISLYDINRTNYIKIEDAPVFPFFSQQFDSSGHNWIHIHGDYSPKYFLRLVTSYENDADYGPPIGSYFLSVTTGFINTQITDTKSLNTLNVPLGTWWFGTLTFQSNSDLNSILRYVQIISECDSPTFLLAACPTDNSGIPWRDCVYPVQNPTQVLPVSSTQSISSSLTLLSSQLPSSEKIFLGYPLKNSITGISIVGIFLPKEKSQKRGTEQSQPESPIVPSPLPTSSPSPNLQSPSISPSPVQSPSISPSPLQSPSISPSSNQPSPSPSNLQSPSISPSPLQSPSISPSYLQSPSISPSNMQSPSISPSPLQSPSISTSNLTQSQCNMIISGFTGKITDVHIGQTIQDIVCPPRQYLIFRIPSSIFSPPINGNLTVTLSPSCSNSDSFSRDSSSTPTGSSIGLFYSSDHVSTNTNFFTKNSQKQFTDFDSCNDIFITVTPTYSTSTASTSTFSDISGEFITIYNFANSSSGTFSLEISFAFTNGITEVPDWLWIITGILGILAFLLSFSFYYFAYAKREDYNDKWYMHKIRAI